HQLAGDAAHGRNPAHRFPVAAVERKCDPHALAIVASNLETIRAPAAVAFTHRNAPVVTPGIEWPSRVPAQQQTIITHHAVDPLVIHPRSPFGVAQAIHHGPRASIAIRRKRSHFVRDLSHERVIISRSAVTALIGPGARSKGPYMHIGARYTQDVADGFHRSSPGNKGERASHFRSRATSIASFRISASSVFLPSRRCSSRICRRAASSSAAGTTDSPAATAISAPTRSSLRQ